MPVQSFQVAPPLPAPPWFKLWATSLNQVLGQIAQSLAQVQAQDGHISTLSGTLDMNGNRIQNVAAPVGGRDVVTHEWAHQNTIVRDPVANTFVVTEPLQALGGINVNPAVENANPVQLAQLPTTTVTALVGTVNQVTVSGSVGVVTLSTPQDLDTGANFQVATLRVGSAATAIRSPAANTLGIGQGYSGIRLEHANRTAAAVPANFTADFYLLLADLAGNNFYIPGRNATW